MWVVENLWIYVGAGFAGLLWGMGTINGAVAIAFMAGIFITNSSVATWAVVALVAGYMVGSLLMSRRGQAAT